MDPTIVKAGLAWAVPVRPDLLVQQLKRYTKAKPILHALRLSHRFGTGLDVHVTKLPTEVLLIIEDIIFTETSQYDFDEHFYDPTRCFQHFENKCEPVDHLEDSYEDLMERVWIDLKDVLCDKCRDGGDEGYSDSKCEKGCRKTIEDEMNGRVDDSDYIPEECDAVKTAWEHMIDQKPKGGFVKFDKVLRTDFGLEAYFATTRASEEGSDVWPDNPNEKWHYKPQQTTICYLTLPKQMTSNATYPLTEYEMDCGARMFDISQASFVQVPNIDDKGKRAKQVQRALRILKLSPFIHPSQLNETVLAQAADGHDKSDDDESADSPSVMSEAEDPASIEWPQLIMLLKMTAG